MDFPFLLSIIVGYIGTWPLQLANAESMGLLYSLQDREEVKPFLSLRMRELDHWNNLHYYKTKLDQWNNLHYYNTKEEQWDDVPYYWTKLDHCNISLSYKTKLYRSIFALNNLTMEVQWDVVPYYWTKLGHYNNIFYYNTKLDHCNNPHYYKTKLDQWNNLHYYNTKLDHCNISLSYKTKLYRSIFALNNLTMLDHWNNPHYYKTKEEQWDDVPYYWTKILMKAFLIPVKTTEPVKTWSTSTTAIVFPDLMEQTVKMILTSAPQVPVKTKDLVQTWSMPTNAFVIVDSTVQILRRINENLEEKKKYLDLFLTDVKDKESGKHQIFKPKTATDRTWRILIGKEGHNFHRIIRNVKKIDSSLNLQIIRSGVSTNEGIILWSKENIDDEKFKEAVSVVKEEIVKIEKSVTGNTVKEGFGKKTFTLGTRGPQAMSHFVGSRGSNIKAVLQELRLLNSNMTIEQKGDNSFQLLYPDDMDGEDLKEAIVIIEREVNKIKEFFDIFTKDIKDKQSRKNRIFKFATDSKEAWNRLIGKDGYYINKLIRNIKTINPSLDLHIVSPDSATKESIILWTKENVEDEQFERAASMIDEVLERVEMSLTESRKDQPRMSDFKTMTFEFKNPRENVIRCFIGANGMDINKIQQEICTKDPGFGIKVQKDMTIQLIYLTDVEEHHLSAAEALVIKSMNEIEKGTGLSARRRTGSLLIDHDIIGHLIGPGNSNINILRAKIQKVDPSAEIFADPIRGNVKLYGTEQSFEFIESLVYKEVEKIRQSHVEEIKLTERMRDILLDSETMKLKKIQHLFRMVEKAVTIQETQQSLRLQASTKEDLEEISTMIHEAVTNESGKFTKLVKITPSMWVALMEGKGQELQDKDHSQSSLKFVSKCPISSKLKKLLEKFADVCGIYMQDGNCAYHCMCDSSKARLGGCFVKTETFFDYCLMYDPVDQSFKKDLVTLWHSTFSRTYYSSSDTYVVCGPNNCLHLYNPSDRSGETTLSMLNPETTEMNGGDIQQVWSLQNWFLILLFAVVGIAVAFVILPKSGISSGTFSYASTLFSCAAGTDHGNGQLENQNHSQIYQSSLNIISNCPNPSEYINKTLEKCADVCRKSMQDENCAYHCMRDSSKSTLVEFCAKAKIFFDYCPEYDPVDQTFQKDIASPCNSTSSRSYYNSSDIYFCNPYNCLQLHNSTVRSDATTLTTLKIGTTEKNGGDIQEELLFVPFLVLFILLFASFVTMCLIWKLRILSDQTRNTDSVYQEDVEEK